MEVTSSTQDVWKVMAIAAVHAGLKHVGIYFKHCLYHLPFLTFNKFIGALWQHSVKSKVPVAGLVDNVRVQEKTIFSYSFSLKHSDNNKVVSSS